MRHGFEGLPITYKVNHGFLLNDVLKYGPFILVLTRTIIRYVDPNLEIY